MKNRLLTLLLFGVCFLMVSNMHAQIKDVFKKKEKKGKSDKGIGVEVEEDKVGISGIYYVWYPPSTKENWFKKISQVAIQYKPETGELVLYTSKKEYIKYYAPGYVKKYDLNNTSGQYFFQNNYRAPKLQTSKIGVFCSLDGSTNINTCELTSFKLTNESYIMSKDKAFIDGMTEEKFVEYSKSNRVDECIKYRDAKAGKSPPPARGIKDADVEKMTLEKAKAKAKRENWKEEVIGVYISSKEWDTDQVWKSDNEVTAGEGAEVILIMKHPNGSCFYQKGQILKNVWAIDLNDVTGDPNSERKLDLIGIHGSMIPLSCEQAQKLLE